MEYLLVPLLLFILGVFILAAILRWLLGTDKLIAEARAQTKLLEKIADSLGTSTTPKRPSAKNPATPKKPPKANPSASPVYEINGPVG